MKQTKMNNGNRETIRILSTDGTDDRDLMHGDHVDYGVPTNSHDPEMTNGQSSPNQSTVCCSCWPRKNRTRDNDQDDPTRDDSYPKEYKKTILALILLFLSAFGKSLVVAYVHQYVNKRDHPLKDIVFERIPYQPWAWIIADVMVSVCSIICIMMSIFHKYNTIVARRGALLAAVLYFFRGVFLACTYLPPPFPDVEERCLPRWNISSDPLQYFTRALELVFTAGFSSAEKGILCGDTIYSGHTMIYVLTNMLVWEYCPRPWRPVLPLTMVAMISCGISCVLISRQHYSIDVVVAVFMTVSIFYGYHAWCDCDRYRFLCNTNWKERLRWAFYFDNCIRRRDDQHYGDHIEKESFRLRPIYLMFLYFERNVKAGNIPNDLAWPCSRPKFMRKLFEKWNKCRGGFGDCLGYVLPHTRSNS